MCVSASSFLLFFGLTADHNSLLVNKLRYIFNNRNFISEWNAPVKAGVNKKRFFGVVGSIQVVFAAQ